MAVDFDICTESLETSSRGSLLCKVSNDAHTITDLEATRAFQRLRADMARHRSQLCLSIREPLRLTEVRLPGHDLGDRAVRALAEALIIGQVQLSILELYKNRLGDAAAQAIAVLIQEAPAPGIHGLHLSHNYLSPLGVGLMLGAAASCGHYPAWREVSGVRRRVPLWLRVERQYCVWPALQHLKEEEQLLRAGSLLKEKEKTLLKKCQAAGTLPKSEDLPSSLVLLCMPPPSQAASIPRPEEQDFGSPAQASSIHAGSRAPGCSSYTCCHPCNSGWPIVHVPYFWSQQGTQQPPEAASLCQTDPIWRSWMPTKPICIQGHERQRTLLNAGVPAVHETSKVACQLPASGTVDADANRKAEEVNGVLAKSSGRVILPLLQNSQESSTESPLSPAGPSLESSPGFAVPLQRGASKAAVEEPQRQGTPLLQVSSSPRTPARQIVTPEPKADTQSSPMRSRRQSAQPGQKAAKTARQDAQGSPSMQQGPVDERCAEAATARTQPKRRRREVQIETNAEALESNQKPVLQAFMQELRRDHGAAVIDLD